MTNKSDVIRRALMNYLSPGERASVQSRIMENSGEGVQHNKIINNVTKKSVSYTKSKPRKKR